MQNRKLEIDFIPSLKGKTKNINLKEINDEYAAIVIQSPNYYGLIEDISKFKISKSTLLISINANV